MRINSFRTFVQVVLLMALSATPGWSYYDDVHFHLTYYIARVVGFTPAQATKIAGANVSVDYSQRTEPVQGFWPTEATQAPRFRFHAFRDESRFPASIGDMENAAEADRAIRGQQVVLWNAGLEDKNPGAFLHFFQDRWPHHRYGSKGGHWSDSSDTFGFGNLAIAVVARLAMGGTTDWLSYQQKLSVDQPTRSNERLFEDTARALGRFMKLAGGQTARTVSAADHAQVLEALRQANVYPEPIFPADIPRIGKLTAGIIARTPEDEAKYGKHLDGPDLAAVTRILNEALHSRGMSDSIPARHPRYDFNAAGRLLNPEGRVY